MLSGTAGPVKRPSLMAEYSSLLADSVLRHKAWFAEHTARIETQLASTVKSEFIANMSHDLRSALKFTPPGGSVTIEAGTGAGGGATVRVRDTGLGMTGEEIAVALTPFGQVDASRSRWREGTGLGLPIAKALVQLHGGRLEIRSAKTLGTEVTVVLPQGSEVSDVHRRAAP